MAVATITLESANGDSVVVSAPNDAYLEDDIILDTNPPVIDRAVATPITTKAVRVTTRVRDAVSGPRSMQVTRAVTTPGTTVAYAPSVRAPMKGRRVSIRVADAAGNWSKWKSVVTRRRG